MREEKPTTFFSRQNKIWDLSFIFLNLAWNYSKNSHTNKKLEINGLYLLKLRNLITWATDIHLILHQYSNFDFCFNMIIIHEYLGTFSGQGIQM